MLFICSDLLLKKSSYVQHPLINGASFDAVWKTPDTKPLTTDLPTRANSLTLANLEESWTNKYQLNSNKKHSRQETDNVGNQILVPGYNRRCVPKVFILISYQIAVRNKLIHTDTCGSCALRVRYVKTVAIQVLEIFLF